MHVDAHCENVWGAKSVFSVQNLLVDTLTRLHSVHSEDFFSIYSRTFYQTFIVKGFFFLSKFIRNIGLFKIEPFSPAQQVNKKVKDEGYQKFSILLIFYICFIWDGKLKLLIW